jgi:alpha/beta superfamily hydrolase
MQFPTWLKPGLLGAGAGAIALAIVGFSWGGWVTSGSAKDMAGKQSMAAVSAALLPYCVEKAGTDPASAETLATLKAATTYSRRSVVEKAGWATPLGSETPNTDLAQACQLKLAEAF